LRDYGRALALAPAMARASLNRGALLGGAGRWPEALADLETALRHGAEPAAAHYNLALAYRALARPEKAREHLEQCLARDPRHAGARALLGRERARGH
jgi:tetratricopeptide (TPR) repeat protein